MIKLTTPSHWAQNRTPGEWADHHLKIVLLLIALGVFGSYPMGVFALAAFNARANAPSTSPVNAIDGSGTVLSMNDVMGTITLQHAGVANLGLPAGTAAFRADPSILRRTEVGDLLNFSLSKEAGVYVITSVHNPALGDGTITRN